MKIYKRLYILQKIKKILLKLFRKKQSVQESVQEKQVRFIKELCTTIQTKDKSILYSSLDGFNEAFIEPLRSDCAIASRIFDKRADTILNPYCIFYTQDEKYIIDDYDIDMDLINTPIDPKQLQRNNYPRCKVKTVYSIINQEDISDLDMNFSRLLQSVKSLTQSIIIGENAVVLQELEKAAKEGKGIIKTYSFDYEVLQLVESELASKGLKCKTIIISADLLPQICSWFPEKAVDQQLMESNNLNKENNLNFIRSINFLGYNWIVIPINKVVEPGTIYVLAHNKIGEYINFPSKLQYTLGKLSCSEDFSCCSLTNQEDIYKIQVQYLCSL